MNKILICNVRMNKDVEKAVYKSEDKHFPVAETEVRYPVMAFLEKNLTKNDEMKIILLVKEDKDGHYKNNIRTCKEEIDAVVEKTGASISTELICTPFEEDMHTHGDLLLKIIKTVGRDAELTVDMTYGPKDQVVILFTALNFAEKFLGCEVANIIYGKAEGFVGGRPTQLHICEMAPLYYVSKLLNKVECEEPERAVRILETLLKLEG